MGFLKDKIMQDVTNKNETKTIAVMLRIFSLMLIVYWVIFAITYIIFSKEPSALIFFIPAILNVFGLVMTYCDGTRIAGVLIQFGTVGFIGISVWKVGINSGGIQLIWPLLVLIIIGSYANIRHKLLRAAALIVYTRVLVYLEHIFEPILIPTGVYKVIFSTLGIVFAAFIMVLILIVYSHEDLMKEKKLIDQNDHVLKIASLDPLTKVFNRRAVNEHMSSYEKNYRSYSNGISVAIGDLDFFKKVNDTYGHEAGDEVLRVAAQIFSKHMSKYGLVARWGGEEFLFIFENMNGDSAAEALEKIRVELAGTDITYNDINIKVTMTFGLEEYDGRNMENTVHKADEKLYIGKQNGRNRVVF